MLSDVHANAEALRAVLNSAEADLVVFLGDAVDYGPDPGEAVDALRSSADVAVMGNHDAAAAFGVGCGCAEELRPLSEYTRREITLPALSRGDLDWLGSLPRRAELDLGGAAAYAVHASPRDPLHGYVMPAASESELEAELVEAGISGPRRVSADLVLLGHTHRPMDREVGGTRVVNPGSVGQPRDGDPRASYAVLEEGGGIRLGRVRYDVEAAVGRVRSLGLEGWAEAALEHLLRRGEVPPWEVRPPRQA